MLKVPNDPFLFKIKKYPNLIVKENLCLMYEEVKNPI